MNLEKFQKETSSSTILSLNRSLIEKKNREREREREKGKERKKNLKTRSPPWSMSISGSAFQIWSLDYKGLHTAEQVGKLGKTR